MDALQKDQPQYDHPLISDHPYDTLANLSDFSRWCCDSANGAVDPGLQIALSAIRDTAQSLLQAAEHGQNFNPQKSTDTRSVKNKN